MHAWPEGAAWLAALRAGAVVPPLVPRVPLRFGEIRIGSVEPGLIRRAGLDRLQNESVPVLLADGAAADGWRVTGDLTHSLARIAAQLREAGLAGAWRDEQLLVANAAGTRLGTVERGAVRPLGVTTLAVHLVGQAPDGRFWIQQRAFDKANDPGLWDTLMGGMVSAADTVDSALARETSEEAGLQVTDLRDLRRGGRVKTARPSSDGGAAYVMEYIDWYTCTVPDGLAPVNQDGEVAQFVLMDAADMLAAMKRDEFTTEAALILADAMGLP
ncbi:MAG: NUDIX domain-containing protein [Polaromonas sp.]|nr:NUDIX domain-containing protein [Polaromonas sp.]